MEIYNYRRAILIISKCSIDNGINMNMPAHLYFVLKYFFHHFQNTPRL
jgi:hypothetical protein